VDQEAALSWVVDSETGVLMDVLLCPPDHYRWIDTNSIAHNTLHSKTHFDAAQAKIQYSNLVELLEQEGVRCHYLEADPDLPYQVYTRDSSQSTPWGPVLTQLRMPDRRGEYARLLEFYARHGGFWRYVSSGTCEGGDIHIIRPGLLLIGYSGVRTDYRGARQFADWFEAEGWEVRLQAFPEHFLHLDVLFCMATDELAVCCVDVLGQDFVDWLAAHGISIIEARYPEAMAMSCNLLALGAGRVISPRHSAHLNDELRARGVSVFDPPLEMFSLGGGSIHCMTMPLRRAPL
jgi:arginine deiminase